MGCWNETCAISRTPIFSGEDVVMIVLWTHLLPKESCGKRPVRLEGYNCGRDVEQIEFGKYDDYGWIENLPGAHSKNMENRVKHGETEAYERAIFIRHSVWDAILAAPMVDEHWHKSVLQHIQIHRSRTDWEIDKPKKTDEFWNRLTDFLKILCFAESCRIDVLGGLAHKGSQGGDLENYKLLQKVERVAMKEWKKRDEEAASGCVLHTMLTNNPKHRVVHVNCLPPDLQFIWNNPYAD